MPHESFETFFARVWQPLSAYGNTLAGSAEVGDELAQEALARLYPKYLLLQEPRAYAFRIVTNLSRTRWTKLARERLTCQQLHDPQPCGPSRFETGFGPMGLQITDDASSAVSGPKDGLQEALPLSANLLADGTRHVPRSRQPEGEQ